MKTQNWFGLGILIIAIAIIAYFIGHYSNDGTRLTNLSQATTSTSLQAQEDLTKNQSDCHNMMQAIAESQGSTASNQSYIVNNHYNISLQKCFVELNQTVILNSTVTNFDSIWDALENRVVARCITKSSVGTISNSCEVTSPAIDQFSTPQEMQDKYMNN
jgi:hypothetical protein